MSNEDIDLSKQNIDLRARLEASFRVLDDMVNQVQRLKVENAQLKHANRKVANGVYQPSTLKVASN